MKSNSKRISVSRAQNTAADNAGAAPLTSDTGGNASSLNEHESFNAGSASLASDIVERLPEIAVPQVEAINAGSAPLIIDTARHLHEFALPQVEAIDAGTAPLASDTAERVHETVPNQVQMIDAGAAVPYANELPGTE